MMLFVPEFVEFALRNGLKEADLPLNEVFLEQVVTILSTVLMQILNKTLQFLEFAVCDLRGRILIVAIVFFLLLL